MARVLIAEGDFLLLKFPGKGGWTYTLIEADFKASGEAFGWVSAEVEIEEMPAVSYKLMPNKQGKLFLAVNASIRKATGKQAGDKLFLRVYQEQSGDSVEEEWQACLDMEENTVQQNFKALAPNERQQLYKYLAEAGTPELRAERILESLRSLGSQ